MNIDKFLMVGTLHENINQAAICPHIRMATEGLHLVEIKRGVKEMGRRKGMRKYKFSKGSVPWPLY